MTDVQDAPKPIDWDDIQARYFQGHTPTEIAAKTGVKVNTISVMACRKGWANKLREARKAGKAVQITVQQAKDDSPKLTAQSDRTRTALADVIARSAEHLAQTPILTSARALRLNQDAESLVRNAKTVFGWSDNNTSPAVRINVMGSAVISSEQTTPIVNEKAIDVASVPVLPPEQKPE